MNMDLARKLIEEYLKGLGLTEFEFQRLGDDSDLCYVHTLSYDEPALCDSTLDVTITTFSDSLGVFFKFYKINEELKEEAFILMNDINYRIDFAKLCIDDKGYLDLAISLNNITIDNLVENLDFAMGIVDLPDFINTYKELYKTFI